MNYLFGISDFSACCSNARAHFPEELSQRTYFAKNYLLEKIQVTYI